MSLCFPKIWKLSKHCKNCECCPVSLFIVRSLKDCHDWGTQISEMSSVSQGFTIHKSVQECFPSVLVIGHGHSHDPSLGLLFDNLRSLFCMIGIISMWYRSPIDKGPPLGKVWTWYAGLAIRSRIPDFVQTKSSKREWSVIYRHCNALVSLEKIPSPYQEKWPE